MNAILFSLVLLGQSCGPRGCGPGGGLPLTPLMFRTPMYVQQPAQSMTARVPPIVDNRVEGQVLRAWPTEGGVLKIELRHADGQAWIYSFPWDDKACFVNDIHQTGVLASSIADVCREQKLTARLSLDPKRENSVAKVELFEYVPSFGGKKFPQLKVSMPKAKDGKKAQGCANPNCKCEDCKCDPCDCGKEPKAKPVGQLVMQDDASIPNMGVDLSKLKRDGKRHYSREDGKEVTRQEAVEALNAEAGGIPDDSEHLFLTTISDEAKCKAVNDIVTRNPQTFANVRVKAYQPSDDMIKDKGFVPESIYLQAANGKTLVRMPATADEPTIVGEVNKKRPDYDPSKDPTPGGKNPLKPLANIDLNQLVAMVPTWAWVIGGIYLFARFNRPQPVK